MINYLLDLFKKNNSDQDCADLANLVFLNDLGLGLDKNKIDYSPESLMYIEEKILNIVESKNQSSIDEKKLVLRFGAYLGEVIKKNTNNNYKWYDFNSAVKIVPTISQFKGDILTSYVLIDDKQSVIFPFAKMFKFLSNGKEDGVYFYFKALDKVN